MTIKNISLEQYMMLTFGMQNDLDYNQKRVTKAETCYVSPVSFRTSLYVLGRSAMLNARFQA